MILNSTQQKFLKPIIKGDLSVMSRLNKDNEYLAKLRDYYARNHDIPPYSKIGKLTGMTAASAYAMVNRLKKNGYLRSIGRQLQPAPRFFDGFTIQTEHAIVTVLVSLSRKEALALECALQTTVTEFLASRQDSLAKAA
jgi:hypothetical protein